MSDVVVGTTVHDPFAFRAGGSLVAGKVDGDWTKLLVCDGVAVTGVAVTVTELAGHPGYYDPAFVPNAVGQWKLFLTVVSNTVTYPFDSDTYRVITAAQADPAAYLAGASVELVSPLSADGGTLRLIQGDSYAAAQSRSLSWTLTAQPDLSTATLTLRITVKGVTVEKTPLSGTNLASGAPTITATLTKIETAGFDPVIGVFDLSAAIGSDEITLVRGRVYVEADV
jgi:hypothetical protein